MMCRRQGCPRPPHWWACTMLAPGPVCDVHAAALAGVHRLDPIEAHRGVPCELVMAS